ncbi:MAG: D-alanyl-D-alanine carboxypeptidase [Clostridiales bacterium]
MSGVRYRYFSCIMILTILIMVFCPLKAWAKPNIQAKAAVLIDGNSGRILWEKNAFQPLPPASTLKIITAITALDLGNIQENCLVGANAAQTGESSIHLREGEQLTLRELLFGALLRSGNDACVAVGENIAGSEGLFVEWLNLKAASLSAFSASLKNTNGLPATNNLISAYDLSLCARYGMANPLFREIVASKNASIGKASSFRNLKNTNKLLWQRDDIVGIKTGTTNEAGNCLVTACRNQDDLLICVVFHSPDRYGESLAILDYGKAQFKSWNLEDKEDIAAYLPLKKASRVFCLYK